MQTDIACLGLDIAKTTIECALLKEGKVRTKTYENSAIGFERLSTWLKQRGAMDCHVACEATGTYWEGVALWLHERGHVVSVLNPAQLHAYAQSQLSRTKTDRQDAKLIAQFCAERRPPPWQPPPAEERELLALVRDLQALQAMRIAESNRLPTAHPSIQPRIERHLTFLDAEMAALLDRIKDHIDKNEGLKQRRDLLDTIPAVGDKTIPWLLAYLSDGQRFAGSKQAVAFAGLNPRHRESGTSVKGKPRISKIGQADLRHALYMPAVVAYSKVPAFKPFVQRLKAKGKSPKLIIVALMRKLLAIAQAVLKSGLPFNSEIHGRNA
jgi:transposase